MTSNTWIMVIAYNIFAVFYLNMTKLSCLRKSSKDKLIALVFAVSINSIFLFNEFSPQSTYPHFPAQSQPNRPDSQFSFASLSGCAARVRRRFVFQFAESKFIYLCTFDLTLPVNGMRAHLSPRKHIEMYAAHSSTWLFSRHMTEFTPTRDTIRADGFDQYWTPCLKHYLSV